MTEIQIEITRQNIPDVVRHMLLCHPPRVTRAVEEWLSLPSSQALGEDVFYQRLADVVESACRDSYNVNEDWE